MPAGVSVSQLPNASIALTRNNCLLFMSTLYGGLAVRNVMIPSLVESMRQLSPSECITHAVIEAQHKIRKICPEQKPEFRSTLDKKFCIGKDFLSKG